MNLLVAESAVLETRAPQIVQCRGDRSQGPVGRGRGTGQVRVAFEANEPHLCAGQHAWIGRAVWLMARPAAFHFYRRVFKDERPPLIPVALEAAGLVSVDRLNH